MSAPYVFTYADALDWVEYTARGMTIGADMDLRKRIIRSAYREVVGARSWSFLHDNARITLRTAQTTGTVSFDLTGGTYERQLTLTGATWPEAWVRDAAIRLGDPPVVCDVEDYKTSTVVTLDVTMCPVADVTSTTYTLYPRWYRLPSDFMSATEPLLENNWTTARQLAKAEIEQLNRQDGRTGEIEYYAFGAPLDLYGAMALYTHPASDSTKTLDVPYVRQPRDIVYSGYDTNLDCKGTVTVSAGSASVTGTSTAFESAMVNSILRIGRSTTYQPGGIESNYPYREQRSIKSVESATGLTVDANVAAAGAAVKYRITDPIDLNVSLYDAFLRCVEKHLARVLRARNYQELEREYERALIAAKEADCRGIQPVVAGAGMGRRTRLSDSPMSRRPEAGFS